MIDFFHTWLPQLSKFCDMIVHRTDLERAWVFGDTRGTSVYYPGELLDQILEDIDAGNMVGRIPFYLGNSHALESAVTLFLKRLSDFEEWAEKEFDMREWSRGRRPSNASSLFTSASWQALEESARRVRSLIRDAQTSR